MKRKYEFDIEDIENLKGMTFNKVYQSDESNPDLELHNDAIIFENDDRIYVLTHFQDCCESVSIEEVHGDLEDLVGTPILQAEETSHRGCEDHPDDSETWTFYKMATAKGYVTIRFYGTSNGYYSESANLYGVKK